MTIHASEQTTSIIGALVGEGPHAGRIVRIDQFVVDVPADGHMLVLRNRDIPGVIGKVGTILGEAATNVASYHQSRRLSGEDGGALAAIVVDQPPDGKVIDRLRSLPEVLQVSVVALNGEP